MGHKVALKKTEHKAETEHLKKPKTSSPTLKRFHIVGGVLAVAFLFLGTSIGIMISADTTPTGFPTVIEPGSNVQDAKFVVFAQGGSYYAKNGSTGAIDYSGTNAITVIASAIGALTAGRTWQEKISLVGDFSFSPPTKTFAINTTNYLLLEGSNARLFLLASSSTSHYGMIGLWNVNNVTIEGLTIDCNKAGQTDGGSDYSQNGIYGVVATKDILVENCIVKNAYKEGIIFMASVGHSANHTNVRILNNNIIGCRIASECMYDSQVIGNYITGANTAGAIEIFGDHRNLTISGNHIINPANDGIQLYVDNTNLASSSTNNVITGNVIQNAGHHGIYILGMRLRYDVISNNAIYMAAYVPIAVYQATYISITDNMIDHYGSGMTYGYGILLENVNYSTVQGNSIYCLDATCLPWGILLSGSSRNSVVGNSITSILGGIGFQTGTAGSHSTNNTIMGNVLGQGLEVDAMDDGIYEYDANQNYNYVIGNSVKAGTAITLNGAQSVKANNIEL